MPAMKAIDLLEPGALFRGTLFADPASTGESTVKAIHYLLKRWNSFTRYTGDGRRVSVRRIGATLRSCLSVM
jgi:hypothetical protein